MGGDGMLDDPADSVMRSVGLPEIAVVGAGCRYPGGVRDLDGLWRALSDGRDAISATPADRWGPGFLDPAGSEGTMYSGRGGFLDDIDAFDARFFGISLREATEIDPQHRLLLTTAWEAMEDSGIPLECWAGSRTGVYTGVLGMDYTLLLAKAKGAHGVGPYYASGKEASFGAGRIAYTFGLHGPCMMLNSACSSSLLAVHLAAQSLRTGECDAAVAGGVSLMLAPELSIFMSRIEALSPSGTCRPFDTAADGVVRGEGCGMVVLKRYRDAIRDGDRILAVLKGSATVHDGRSAGLIAPNAEAQESLLRAALAAASVSAREVDYLETHCTGTSLGDRIEVSALAAVLRERTGRGTAAADRIAQGELRPHRLRRRDPGLPQGHPGRPARRRAAADPPGVAIGPGDRRRDSGRHAGCAAARGQAEDGRRERLRPVRHERPRRPPVASSRRPRDRPVDR